MDSRIFMIRRISGHLRYDDGLWTFLYFCDPYTQMDDAHFASDIPGNMQPPLESWVTDVLRDDTPEAFIDDLAKDGFGLVLRILREIKTSWKLLLNELEVFLEELVRRYPLVLYDTLCHTFGSSALSLSCPPRTPYR